MIRINKKMLQGVVNLVNRVSKTKYGIEVEYSNGLANLYQIDKCEYPKEHTMIRHLYSGNKRECYDYLQGMLNAIYYLV